VVSTLFAVTYVAAYSVQMTKKGLVPKKNLGCWNEHNILLLNAFASGFRAGRAVFSTTALRIVNA
jgi:hypothetical protein